jgi:hypothetical protein
MLVWLRDVELQPTISAELPELSQAISKRVSDLLCVGSGGFVGV